MKKNTESIGKEKMTDQELSDAFGRYQRRESIGILLLARIAAKISEQELFSKYSASPVLRFVATAVKRCGDL